MRTLAKHTLERLIVGARLPDLDRLFRGGRSLVLAYHNVVPDGVPPGADESLHMPRRRFAEHLDVLASSCDVVPLADLHTGSARHPRPRIALTFDDGYEGALTVGMEEVTRRGLPATLFVAPGLLGARTFWWDCYSAFASGERDRTGTLLRDVALERLAGRGERVEDWCRDQGLPRVEPPAHARGASIEVLERVARMPGITIGSHTWSHPNLTRVSEAEAMDELVRSREWLESRFDGFEPVFAHPYGIHSPATDALVAKAGYRGGYTLAGSFLPPDPAPGQPLSRLNVPAGLTREGLRLRTVWAPSAEARGAAPASAAAPAGEVGPDAGIPPSAGHGSTLRIALMIETDGPGGAEIMLLHHAAELQRRGHECVFVGPAEGEGWLRARMRELGLTTEVVGFHRSLDPLAVRDLVRILRRHRIEVVHSHEFMMAVCGAAATTLLRVPHVITMHGGRYYQERRQRRIALRWAARRSPGVVAVSESARQEMASTLRIPSAEVHVIRNGVPAREGDRTGARDSLGLTEDTLLVLAIGSLYPVKGHIVLLRAFARLRETRPGLDAVVAIAGKGGEEAALREYASRVGIEERVRFLGFRADVPDLLAAADVFVMPSRMEGHPLALIEAMFAGRAIVASRVGGIPEILEDGETGIMVEADDPEALASALAELADSPATRVALGKAARAWARVSCRLEAMTDSYETLYRRALSGDG